MFFDHLKRLVSLLAGHISVYRRWLRVLLFPKSSNVTLGCRSSFFLTLSYTLNVWPYARIHIYMRERLDEIQTVLGTRSVPPCLGVMTSSHGYTRDASRACLVIRPSSPRARPLPLLSEKADARPQLLQASETNKSVPSNKSSHSTFTTSSTPSLVHILLDSISDLFRITQDVRTRSPQLQGFGQEVSRGRPRHDRCDA